MTQYINTETLEYPISQDDIKLAFPTTSFESEFKPIYPFAEVLDVEINAQGLYKKIVEIAPIYKDGMWYKAYSIEDMTPTEIQSVDYRKASLIRSKRAGLLSQTDWTQVADAPVDKQAWATYRQALRDITSQPGFPLEVIWPIKPE